MKKNYLLIGILIFALLIGGIYLYMSSGDFEVGNSKFKAPDNFVYNNSSSLSSANIIKISNKDTFLRVGELTYNAGLNKTVTSYAKSMNNSDVKVSDFKIDDNLKGKKVVSKNKKDSKKVMVRYYVLKNDKVYYVESTADNKDIDNYAKGILSSIH